MAGNHSAVKVHIDHVVKKFNGRNGEMVALNGVDMDIHENEFICVVGPSGCGKSTLLNIIGGLETPTEGKVLVDGAEVTGPGPDRGIVFQQYALFPWLTVEKNVQFGLKLQGKSKEEAEELAHKYLKMVDLEGFAKAYPKELSGGMKQRVGIARAYANSPNIMLLDEPFGQLDAQTRMFMQKETARIWEQEKRTVIFVTNNIDEALFLGDRIILMEGKLPGSIKTEYMIDLPRPREHTSMELLKLRSIITDNTALVL